MLSKLSYKSWFWVLQVALLFATILYLSWSISSTPRGAFAVPSFQAVFELLLFWAAVTKLPVLLIQYALIRRTFWLESSAFIRVLLFYFTDLIGGILAIVLLWQLWVATLFTDAGFPASLVVFPYSMVSAVVLGLLVPAAKKSAGRIVEEDVHDPLISQLVPFLFVLLALSLSFLLATTIAENSFDLFGQVLAFFPVTLLFARIYLDPALVAARRKPQRAIRVLLFNVLTGWTVIGWLFCLLWARLSKSTITTVKEKLNWKRYISLVITATGMILTGAGISSMGDALDASQSGADANFTAQIVVLLLCILWMTGGLRLLVKSAE